MHACSRRIIWHLGGAYSGLELSRGIKQGCPLSATMCYIALDPVLRRALLIAYRPLGITVGYMDDLAQCIADMVSVASDILRLFECGQSCVCVCGRAVELLQVRGRAFVGGGLGGGA